MLTQKYVPVARKSALEILFKVRFMLLTRGGGYPLASLMSLPTPNRFRHYSKHGLLYGLGAGVWVWGSGAQPLWDCNPSSLTRVPGCPGAHTIAKTKYCRNNASILYLYYIIYICLLLWTLSLPFRVWVCRI